MPYVIIHIDLLHLGPLSDAVISKIQEPVFSTEVVFGPDISSGENFEFFAGKISELNVLSDSLSETELINVTSNCDKINIGKKIFDWSHINSESVTIPNGTEDIKTEMRETFRICRKRQKVLMTLLPFPSKMKEANDVCLAFGGDTMNCCKYLNFSQ